jgi:cytochrome c-type biogenesis protein CcmH
MRAVLLRGTCLVVALYLLSVSVSHAVIETYQFSSTELEQRYKSLSAELRCPKCQNQNIADSDAPIAQDLRKLLYKQLESGANDEEILEFMVSRYGEFVRYKPRFGGPTLILWLMPGILILGALVILLVVLKGNKRKQQAISSEEQEQLDALFSPIDSSVKDTPPGANTP